MVILNAHFMIKKHVSSGQYFILPIRIGGIKIASFIDLDARNRYKATEEPPVGWHLRTTKFLLINNCMMSWLTAI